jgi:hypothetical protein
METNDELLLATTPELQVARTVIKRAIDLVGENSLIMQRFWVYQTNITSELLHRSQGEETEGVGIPLNLVGLFDVLLIDQRDFYEGLGMTEDESNKELASSYGSLHENAQELLRRSRIKSDS